MSQCRPAAVAVIDRVWFRRAAAPDRNAAPDRPAHAPSSFSCRACSTNSIPSRRWSFGPRTTRFARAVGPGRVRSRRKKIGGGGVLRRGGGRDFIEGQRSPKNQASSARLTPPVSARATGQRQPCRAVPRNRAPAPAVLNIRRNDRPTVSACGLCQRPLVACQPSTLASPISVAAMLGEAPTGNVT
jgi:hypothetical protein